MPKVDASTKLSTFAGGGTKQGRTQMMSHRRQMLMLVLNCHLFSGGGTTQGRTPMRFHRRQKLMLVLEHQPFLVGARRSALLR